MYICIFISVVVSVSVPVSVSFLVPVPVSVYAAFPSCHYLFNFTVSVSLCHFTVTTSMTIVLLSKSSNTLYGIRISEYFSFLTTRLEHPTSPVLLTKSGPLRDLIQCDTTAKIAPPHTHLKFKNRPRLFQSHEL